MAAILEEIYYALMALAAACALAFICIIILAFCGCITCSVGGGFLCCTVQRRKKHPDGTVTYESCCQSCCGGNDPEAVLTEESLNQIGPGSDAVEREASCDDLKKAEDAPPSYEETE
ncbi:Oidioi.mRNA.OKI2018_I69.PAR.g9429.t1.cds [Oikopleura dioica]|uniref:Oidioi.mRNA.OKI2018_I69.PAR.g9429.t1.cds n=1 Tax=Oikopleura dioica TaxID=34765 RepID=A0ABN7RRC2_OIKDI|nr:Oidioi.mRNA.OKI2018_I69.PAR.g9429.t1.cds [Oikopleura dioica]